MNAIFDFDPELVEQAMRGDSAEVRRDALEQLCKAAFNDYTALETEIKRKKGSWHTEWIDRARDLFLHDRFLGLFANPPTEKIENINALCQKMLNDSINDAYRFFLASKRSAAKTVYADTEINPDDPTRTFWALHEAKLEGNQAQLRMMLSKETKGEEIIMRVKAYMASMSPIKRRVLQLWLEDFTEREIAEELGLTTGNVGCIISRTLSYLRKKLCKKP